MKNQDDIPLTAEEREIEERKVHDLSMKIAKTKIEQARSRPVNVPAYIKAIARAQGDLTQAMRQATLMLPSAVKTQHWVASRHSPSAWHSVEAAYIAQSNHDPVVLNTITNLALLADAIACLQAITLGANEEERPLDLTLKKVKRVES